MAERNASIAAILDEIADLLDIQGANPFRVRAYRNAARSISDLGTEVDVWIERGTPLTDIPGIGADLAKKIVEILQTGTCEFLQALHRELPAGVTQLLKIPALGPRRVKTLFQDLHIENLEQLLDAAKAGRIRTLPGFGEKTEQRLLEAAQGRLARARRYPLVTAASYAEPLAEHLRHVPGVSRVEIAGSYRRMRASVGDLDIVAIAAEGSPIMDQLVAYSGVTQVLSKGSTRSSVLVEPGIQVDVRSVGAESFGAAMVYFTGSKAHNIAIRRMGQDRGLKINEYGVFREDARIAGDNEESVYRTIDLPWIAPELREDRAEIQAAQAGKLPQLVQLADLRGDLHLRGVTSSARQRVNVWVQAAQARGLQYIGIVEDAHALLNGGAALAVKLDDELSAIDRHNRESSALPVFTGLEVAIDADGTLRASDALLAKFDFVIAAVASELELPRDQQTQRVLKALDHPRVAVLAQPVQGDQAATLDLDFAAVVHKARERNVAFELTLHPRRIAPPDHEVELAKRERIPIAISSHAGRADELDGLRFSVGFARRGGLEAGDALNACSLDALREWLLTRMRRSAREDRSNSRPSW